MTNVFPGGPFHKAPANRAEREVLNAACRHHTRQRQQLTTTAKTTRPKVTVVNTASASWRFGRNKNRRED